MLRDLVNATIGFEEQGATLQVPSKSLHRMLSPQGKPQHRDFFRNRADPPKESADKIAHYPQGELESRGLRFTASGMEA